MHVIISVLQSSDADGQTETLAFKIVPLITIDMCVFHFDMSGRLANRGGTCHGVIPRPIIGLVGRAHLSISAASKGNKYVRVCVYVLPPGLSYCNEYLCYRFDFKQHHKYIAKLNRVVGRLW